MDLEKFFLVVLEIAVAIMGFSGITIAVASREADTSKENQIGFNALLVAPVFLAALA